MAEIQGNIVKRGKRNTMSRHFHAKNDKEAIATWRLDLNRILHVFNVRPLAFVRPLLTVRIQTELAINTNVVVSDIHQGVVNTHVTISELQHSVTKTHTIVSDIHRTVVRGQEGAESTSSSVSVARTIFVTKSTLTEPRLKPGWLS